MNDQDRETTLRTLRDTPEQDRLSDLFRSCHSGRTNTTPCPACCPQLVGSGRKGAFFERGHCGELVAMKCNNCGFIRVSSPRTSKAGVPTKAQQAAIDRINRYFTNEARGPLLEFRVEATDYGTFWVVVRTGGHYMLSKGGLFAVGKRGSVECHSEYGLNTPEHSLWTKNLYNREFNR